MDFQPFHDYNRLVRRGILEPLRCPNDDVELVLMGKSINGELEPALKCFACGTLTVPGLRLFNSIRDAVQNHYQKDVNGVS